MQNISNNHNLMTSSDDHFIDNKFLQLLKQFESQETFSNVSRQQFSLHFQSHRVAKIFLEFCYKRLLQGTLIKVYLKLVVVLILRCEVGVGGLPCKTWTKVRIIRKNTVFLKAYFSRQGGSGSSRCLNLLQ